MNTEKEAEMKQEPKGELGGELGGLEADISAELSEIDELDECSTSDSLADPVSRKIAVAGLKSYRRICNGVSNEGLLKLGYRRRQCLWPATLIDVKIMDSLAVLLSAIGRGLMDWIAEEAPGFARSALEACKAPPRRALSSSAFYKFSMAKLSGKRVGHVGTMKPTQWATPVDD